jgi:hypothetical protein
MKYKMFGGPNSMDAFEQKRQAAKDKREDFAIKHERHVIKEIPEEEHESDIEMDNLE